MYVKPTGRVLPHVPPGNNLGAASGSARSRSSVCGRQRDLRVCLKLDEVLGVLNSEHACQRTTQKILRNRDHNDSMNVAQEACVCSRDLEIGTIEHSLRFSPQS